jgi:hypothetical protein
MIESMDLMEMEIEMEMEMEIEGIDSEMDNDMEES